MILPTRKTLVSHHFLCLPWSLVCWIQSPTPLSSCFAISVVTCVNRFFKICSTIKMSPNGDYRLSNNGNVEHWLPDTPSKDMDMSKVTYQYFISYGPSDSISLLSFDPSVSRSPHNETERLCDIGRLNNVHCHYSWLFLKPSFKSPRVSSGS